MYATHEIMFVHHKHPSQKQHPPSFLETFAKVFYWVLRYVIALGLMRCYFKLGVTVFIVVLTYYVGVCVVARRLAKKVILSCVIRVLYYGIAF